MSDLIDRQAAIYIASGYCHPANVAEELAKLPSVDIDLSGFCDKLWRLAYERGKAERAKEKWIPCSERMPDRTGRYLVTNRKWGEWETTWNIYYADKEAWLWDTEIVAWMPMPEPYKEGEQDG